ncbi:MAG: hypothetical protein ACLUVG_12110 [Phocaeicola vulgatus]
MYVGDYTYQSMQAFWWGGKIDPENPKIISVYDALKPKLGENFTLESIERWVRLERNK